MIRSMLFIPGNAPALLINGNYLGADALIFDLEDAVAPEEKDAARILVRSVLGHLDFGNCQTMVRINGMDGEAWEADLAAMMACRPDLIMLPKVSCREDILQAHGVMTGWEEDLGLPPGGVGIMALIETARGVEEAASIAGACDRVKALFLGAEDLTADLRCKRTREGREIDYARARLVAAARAAGIGVYDTPFTDVLDEEGLLADALTAKSLGFDGKACITPAQVPLVNRVFSPSREEVDYAYEVLDVIAQAKREGKGAVALRGKMIDAPIVTRAKQVIAAAEAMGKGR